MSTRSERLWAEARELVWPLATYWIATLLSLTLFTGILAVYEMSSPNSEDLAAIAGVWGATILGLGLGQVLALLRMRTYVAFTAGTLAWTAVLALLFASALMQLDGAAMLGLAMVWILFPFFLLSGLWSLRVHMGLLATWAPLMWLTACVLIIADHRNTDDAWFAGNKWAIWDLFTAPFLLLGVGLTLAFLASRERHRLHHWRHGPQGPDLPATERKGRTARPNLGLGGLFMLTLLMLALTGASGAVAPYLWNTVESEDSDHERPSDGTEPGDTDASGNNGGSESDPNQGGDPTEGDGSGEPQEGDGSGEPQEGDGPSSAGERVKEAAKRAGSAVSQLLLLVLLAIAGLFIFGPPTRRALLLRHLRHPLWPVPPTRRVQQAWRIVEIALGDHGVHRGPGDTAVGLVNRARAELDEHLDWVPLEQTAELADRVVYGLGMEATDVDLAGRHADMAYESLQERMGERERLWAWYRML